MARRECGETSAVGFPRDVDPAGVNRVGRRDVRDDCLGVPDLLSEPMPSRSSTGTSTHVVD